MDLNKVQIIGRVTQDPETRTTPSGLSVTSFSVATNLIWKNQSGEKQEKAEFHNIVAWRRLAEICGQYLTKGRQVYIEGRIQTRSWEGQDGVKRYRTEIIAENIIFLGPSGTARREIEETPPPTEELPTQEIKQEPVIEEVSKVKGEETDKISPENEAEVKENSEKEKESDEIKIEDMPF